MNTKSLEDVGLREQAFYNTPFKFSFSSLSRLLEAPSIFYKEYVIGEREIKSERYLVMGSLIHCLLLDPDAKDQKFILSPTDLPGGEGKNVIDRIFELYTQLPEDEKAFTTLENFAPEIITILKEINLHQRLTDDGKRIAKIIDEKNINYFEFLKRKGSRELIDPDMLNEALLAVEVIKADPALVSLLAIGQESSDTFAIYNEIELAMDLPSYPFGLKGIIDNMVIDAIAKTIVINDFKTSSKILLYFPESVENYKYWLQAAIYYRLVKNYLGVHNINIEDGTWKIEINFVVIDKYNQVYPFKVSEKSLTEWQQKTDDVLNQALYHYQNRSYKLPYAFATGSVTL
jgi:hypothetical protein